MKVGRALWLGLGLLTASWQIVAQDGSGLAPYEEYSKHLRAAEEVTPLTSTLFGDQTSLYNGATEFDVTDIDLPGNSHLPVRLSRRLVVDDRRLDPGNLGGFGDWDVEVPYIDGSFVDLYGWTILAAGGGQSYSRCSLTMAPYTALNSSTGIVPSAFNFWDGDQLHIPGETSEELLANTESMLPAVSDGNTYPWITKSFYRATCAPSTANGYAGESFIVVSPNGDRYTFNWAKVNYMAPLQYHYSIRTAPGTATGYTGRSHIFLLATEVDDRFGNWVKYGYNSTGQLTQITANDGRAISIQWSGNNIASATTGVRTWQYGYTSNGALTYTDAGTAVTINPLSSVTRPDGSTWKYAITSGALKSILNPPDGGGTPPTYYCQIDPIGNTGNVVYTMDAPSGAHGVFNFVYQRHVRTYVPKSCSPNTGPNENYPLIFDFFDNFTLTSKQITGAGLTPQNWSYSYSENTSGYVEASVPYQGTLETYIPQSATAYSPPKIVTVTDPTEITKYSFGVNYGVDEGRLLATEVDTLGGTVMKTVTSTYLSDSTISSQAFPSNAGQSVQSIAKNPMVGRLRPETAVVTVQVPEGDTYTRQTNGFDVFAHPTDVVRSNSIAGQTPIEEKTTYFNDYSQWVIGLTQEVDNLSNNGEAESLNTYNSNATLASSARFGETLLTYGYNAQGQLSSFVDGNSHTTTLGNYYRGIPQLITYPDNTTQSAVVDDYGEISSVTDQNGYQTSYTYNSIGWPATITYPTGDEVAWFPTNYTFTYVTSTERGIAAGHWRRVVSKGLYNETTYFDAMLHPLLTDTNFNDGSGNPVANSDISSANSYDWKGQNIFSSYPQTVAANVGDNSISTGTTRTFDVLGRVTLSQQDSEQGKLSTNTSYLPGAGVKVTDPNSNATTTYYQVFDQPSFDSPITVQAPQGITQTIARDLYSKPLSITQSGLYNGTESDSVTKTLVYDAYHRLCRTNEPESGSEITTYDGANNVAYTASGLTITEAGCAADQLTASSETSYTYDPLNRVLTILPPSGTQSTQYQYDPAGNLKIANSGSTAWQAFYNHRNMMTSEALSITGLDTLTLGYAHDAYGSLSTITYPGGEGVAYTPNPRGWDQQVGTYASQLGYFANGEVASFVYGNGANYAATQNARQLLGSFSYGTGAITNINETLGYDYDANINTVTDALNNGQRSKTFQYDGLNRLTNAQASNLWGTESYSYDPLNNLRTRLSAGQTSTYNYDTTNRLATITRGGSAISAFQYDTRGNVASKNSITFLFDQKNQLSQIQGYDSYLYDAPGRRAVKTPTSGNPTYSFYSHAGQLIYQYVPNGATAVATNFIYLGTKLIARNSTTISRAPATPTVFAVPSASNNGSANLTWNAEGAATSYVVQQSADGGSTWTGIYNNAGTSTSVSGLVDGSYIFQLQACNTDGCSGWVTGGALVITHPPTASPIINVPGTSSSGSYTVTWTGVNGQVSYTLQEQVNGGGWTTVQSNGTFSWGTSGRSGGTYGYQVQACNVGGCGPWSATGTITVTLPPTGTPAVTTPATSYNGAYAISWTTVAATTSYVFQESVNSGAWATVQSTGATSWSTSGRGNGSYGYRVEACNVGGCGAFSPTSTTTVTLPPASAPTLTVPSTNYTGSYSVSWTAVATATSYTLQESVNSGTWTNVQASGATSWGTSGRGNGTYAYRVQACNVAGCGGFSSTGTNSVSLPPATAPGLTVPSSNATGSYSVSWSAVATATSYTLQERVNGAAYTTVQATGTTSWGTSGRGNGAYTYQVQACNAVGCGPMSGASTVTILLPPAPPPTVTAPSYVHGVQYYVIWTAAATATSYNVQRTNLGTGSSSVFATTSSTSTTIAAPGASQNFQYAVQACNAGGCSAYKNAPNATATDPPGPIN